ncbi:MAG: hypothetical protein M1839_001458 [Geoglossum umbratile]|nr:MAG: hypothetical protein M1839_001458 [Geoglossum umbratile]
MSITEYSRYGSNPGSDRPPPMYESSTVTLVEDPEHAHCNLISFLAIAQTCGVDLHSLVWHQAENMIARGGTSYIRQRIVSEQFSFIFKQMSLSHRSPGLSVRKDLATEDHRSSQSLVKGTSLLNRPSIRDQQFHTSASTSLLEDSAREERRAFQSLMAEVSILTHPSIRDYRNIINLEGVCWEISDDGKAWPILMFEKAQFGNLHQFMNSSTGRSLDFEESLQICRDIASAVAAMHSGSIIHGDIKPENVLMFADTDGSPFPKVSDFGYSTLVAKEDDLIQLPISKPWNAPEVHHRGNKYHLTEAKKMDSYSFGILCLWILFGNRYEKWIPQLRDCYNDGTGSIVSENILLTVENLKGLEGLPDFAEILLTLNESTIDRHKTELEVFFQLTLTSDLEFRTNDFIGLLQLLGDHRPTMNAKILTDERGWRKFLKERAGYQNDRADTEEIASVMMHADYQIAPHCTDFLTVDFRVRNYVVQCLQKQADNDPCEDCRRNAAFQIALCSKIGFAIPRSEEKSLEWLIRSGQNNLDEEIKKTDVENISSSYRLAKLQIAGTDSELDQGHHYMRFGIIGAAENQIKREIEDMQHSLSKSHTAVKMLKHSLSLILEAKKDHVGSEELRKDLQKTAEEEGSGDITPDINLAITLQHRGKLKQAGDLLDHAYGKLKIRDWGEDGGMLVWLKTVQAEVFQEQGRYEVAEKTYREALECDQKILGHNSETMWKLLLGIALSLFHQDKLVEAEKMFQEAADMCKVRFGEHHIATKRAFQWLADTQSRNGKQVEAEATYRYVVKHSRTLFGEHHLETLKVTCGLAAVLYAGGKFREAQSVLRSILQPIQDMDSDDNVEALEVLSKSSHLLVTLGQRSEAEPLLQRARREYQLQYRPDLPGFAAAVGDQAQAFFEAGKLDEAEELYEMIVGQVLERKDLHNAEIINNYALLLCEKHEFERAEKLHRWALGIQQTFHGDEHPSVLTSLNNIGVVQMRSGKITEAEGLLRTVLDARTKVLGKNHFHTLRTSSHIAVLFFIQGRIREAEIAFAQLLQAQEEVLGMHPDVIRTMVHLSQALIFGGKAEEGKSMRERALQESQKLLGAEHPLTRMCQAVCSFSLEGGTPTIEFARSAISAANRRPEMANQVPIDVWLGALIPNGFSDITSEIKATEAELAGSTSANPRCLFHSMPPVALRPDMRNRSDFDTAEHFVTSEDDEQLLLFLKFRKTVKIHSIHLTSLPESNQEAKRPLVVKLFTNRINSISWNEAEEEPGVQAFTIDEKDWNEAGTTVLQTYFVKFQKINDLVLFVHQGQGDYTRLDRIRIIGK